MPLLLREAIGGTIRRARTERQRTLRDVSREARVSLGYLSEIERGRKEPSSELLASICDALALPLPDLLDDVAESMRPVRPVRAARSRSLALAGPIDPALRSAVEEAFAPEQGDEAPTETTADADEVAEPVETVDPAQLDTPGPGAEETGAEALDRAGADLPVGDAPDGLPEDGEGADDDEAPAADPAPTVRLVGLVTVSGPGPVVYAA